ncbi:MAG: GGDEF domain-containing protein [Xanthobacteraceae bacterium]|nr:GGDEF domain-containing protein [Xanthobacteraceae bacterium]
MELGPQEDQLFLATNRAGQNQRRQAAIVIGGAIVAFLIAAPFARVQLPPAWAFLSVHESALFVISLITAVLLFGQFEIVRSRALLVLAAGYLYAAVMAIPHLLAFPGIFGPHGLLGNSPQISTWIYVFWRVGYEIAVIAYALMRHRAPAFGPRGAGGEIAFAIAVVLIAAVFFTLVASVFGDELPVLAQADGRYTTTTLVIAILTWGIALIVLYVFWSRRPDSVLDLWLTVVIVLSLLAALQSSLINTGRFDFGFYSGRLFGLAAASFVLINLLVENGRLYAKLAAGQAELRRLTTVDPLTGIANRRAFDTALDTEWRRAMRNRAGLSLLLLDVDCFKSFNDVYGHPAGDDCLRKIAGVLVGTARRGGELIARCGGEEFAVLLPGVGSTEAAALAQRVCQSVRDLNVAHAASTVTAYVTVSIGVAAMLPARLGDTRQASPASLVERADRALYAAKAAGRNRVAEDANQLAVRVAV